MRKLLGIGLLLSSCGKVVDVDTVSEYQKTIEEKALKTPNIKKYLGYKKIGVAGTALNTTKQGLEIKNTVTNWTQNENTGNFGNEYSYVSGKIQLLSSSSFDAGKYSSAINSFEFKQNVQILKQTLIAISKVGSATDRNKFIILPNNSNPKDIFNDKFVSKLYISLQNNKPITMKNIFNKTKLLYRYLGEQVSTASEVENTNVQGNILYATDEISILFLKETLNIELPLNNYSTFSSLLTEDKTKEFTKEALTSKYLGLKEKNLDALFVQVRDGEHNSEDVYKSFVESNNFKDTEIIMIGDKAKSQSGSSTKVFAKDNITTGSYSEYASAFIAGYKSAVMQIKWSKSEQEWEKTTVTFLIASISDSESKKKAFAFRRGVEAASAHEDYSTFLKVKFVSKTEDSSKSSKKLYREVSEWQNKDDSKSKLYEFASSDTFSDADRRVVYISGTTAKDWRGTSINQVAGRWNSGDDTGLIGALYNYSDIKVNNTKDEALSSKAFQSGISIILDSKDSVNNSLIGDNTNVEVRDISVLGYLGKKETGIALFTEDLIKEIFLTKDEDDNKRWHRHSIFGGDFNLQRPLNWNDKENRAWNKLVTWYAINNAFEDVSLTEDELIKESSWMK